MAAAAFRHLCAAAGVAGVAESAGLAAAVGMPMTPQAEFALRLRGVPVDGRHRSRPLTRELVDAADAVVVMTTGHLRAARVRFPAAAGKMRLLMSFAPSQAGGAAADVADPFGGDSEEYVACLEMMWPALEGLVKEERQK
jgi:protein-tyrosine-phosphatase